MSPFYTEGDRKVVRKPSGKKALRKIVEKTFKKCKGGY
jgi:hypothetical protein